MRIDDALKQLEGVEAMLNEVQQAKDPKQSRWAKRSLDALATLRSTVAWARYLKRGGLQGFDAQDEELLAQLENAQKVCDSSLLEAAALALRRHMAKAVSDGGP